MTSCATAGRLAGLRTRCGVMAFGLLLGACDEPAPPPPLPPSADPVAPTTSVSYKPRTRHYFVANDHDTCTVFWEEGMQTSKRKTVACPREIVAGERARLTGRTCIRESARKERNVPMRCPKEVLYAERDDREKKGEFRLPPQDSE